MFWTIKLCTHAELFEIELIICLKMDLALNYPEWLICHKIQTTNLPLRSSILYGHHSGTGVKTEANVHTELIHVSFYWSAKTAVST